MAKQALQNIDLKSILDIAKSANAVLKKYFENREYVVQSKSDTSPVTDADHAANDVIVSGLKHCAPHIPIISEEVDNEHNLKVLQEEELSWLVDPLDGTWSFIKGKQEFTTNIALVRNSVPIIGILGVPMQGWVYFNDAQGKVYKLHSEGVTELLPKNDFPQGYDFLVSHRNLSQQMQDFVNQFQIKSITPVPSALKFGLMAEGLGDIYPRFKETCVWDTAAGHALLLALGGDIYELDGKPLRYKSSLLNPNFVAVINNNINLMLNQKSKTD